MPKYNERKIYLKALSFISAAAIAFSALSFSYAFALETSLAANYKTSSEYITPVKSQNGNLCWAYSATSTLFTKLLISKENISTNDTTEQRYIDSLDEWSSARFQNSEFGWQRYTYEGGFFKMPLGYFSSGEMENYLVTAVQYASKNNINDIKKQIVENGAVAANFKYSYLCENKEKTTYFFPEEFNGHAYTVGHAVEIVGWDDNFDKNLFSNIPPTAVQLLTGSSEAILPKNNGAWLCKNSWGNYNSLGGYVWISYEDSTIFNDNYDTPFSVKSYIKINDDKKVYQTDKYGATYELTYTDYTDKVTFINIFDFSQNYRTLDKVVFEQADKNVDYSIFYIPIDKKTNQPASNEADWQLLYNGTADYAGYICAEIDEYDLPKGIGAIGIQYEKSDSGEAKIGVAEQIILLPSTLYFNNNVKHGQSYIYSNGKYTDLIDYYKEALDDSHGATFAIKAITNLNKNYVAILGDSNMDDKMDIKDVSLILKYIVKLEGLNSYQMQNADFNKDTKVNITDVSDILKALVKLI